MKKRNKSGTNAIDGVSGQRADVSKKRRVNKEKILSILKNVSIRAVAVILAIGVWQYAAHKAGMELLLASPLAVAKRLSVIWREDGFLSTVLFSLLRIMRGFLIAFAAGTILAFVAFFFKAAEIILLPYVTAIKSVPVASFIILSLIWLSSYDRLTVLIAFLIAFPVIYSNVLAGLKATDSGMLEMARIYKVPMRRRLFYIYVPQIKPFLISSCGVSIGMAWKAGIAAEVLGVVKGSVGEKLYESKIYLLSADLIAWTVIIVIVSAVIEKAFTGILKLLFKGASGL